MAAETSSASPTIETLGQQATRLALEKANEWMNDCMIVVTKSVQNMARQGLFHCTVRFEDLLPCDPQNQTALINRLAKQDLIGEFRNIEGGVELTISWGRHSS